MFASIFSSKTRESMMIGFVLVPIIALQGCANMDGAKALTVLAGCAAGGVGGAYAGKAVAKRQGSSASGVHQIVGAGIGCLGGAAAAGAIYSALSEQGKKNREVALIEAAKTARVQRYTDPAKPDLIGIVTPSPAVISGERECVENEDVLADKEGGERAFVTYCRDLPNGEWRIA